MIIAVFSLIFAAFLGSYIAQKSIHHSLISIKHFFAFSGAFLFGLTITHLLPELYQHPQKSLFSTLILCGFLLQLFLEKLTKGIEHGHLHQHDTAATHHHHIPWSVYIGLSIHAFLEGLPIAQSIDSNNKILTGILIHKIPESIALMSVLLCGDYSVKKPWLFMLIFAMLSPIGVMVGYFIQINGFAYILQPAVALVIGSFIHIASTIIFESGNTSHHLPFSRIVAIGLGFAIAVVM
jgi:zinc transporter ZupT